MGMYPNGSSKMKKSESLETAQQPLERARAPTMTSDSLSACATLTLSSRGQKNKVREWMILWKFDISHHSLSKPRI